MMHIKRRRAPGYAWLSAEQPGLSVTGDLLCLGFAFPSAGAWVDSRGPLPSALTGTASSARQRTCTEDAAERALVS